MDEFEEQTKCSVCKNAVLYGSRHHACGSYAMDMEKQINEKDKEIQTLRVALGNLIAVASQCDSWESFPSGPLDDAYKVLTE